MNALTNLTKALEAAPKSAKGFVNWARNQKLQAVAVSELVKDGVEINEAKRLAWNTGRHFDTNYHKHSDR